MGMGSLMTFCFLTLAKNKEGVVHSLYVIAELDTLLALGKWGMVLPLALGESKATYEGMDTCPPNPIPKKS